MAAAQIVEVGVGVEAVLCHLDLGNCHVAAVVADALVVGQQVFQHEAILDGAAAGLQAGDVPCLDGTHQLVHDGLQRFDLACQMQVILAEGVSGAVQHVLHGVLKHLQLFAGVGGKVDLLGVHLLCGFQKVHGMVADALEIADGVEQSIHALAVRMVQLTAGQLDQIGAESIFVLVNFALLIPDFLGQRIIPGVGQAHGLHDAHTGQLGHVSCSRVGAGHGHSRGVQQTLIQQSKALFFGVVRDGEDGQLFQTICEGEKDEGGRDVEGGVDHSNAPGGDGLVHKIKVDHGVQTVETGQKDRDTDDVEVEVDHGGTAGILICAHRRNQRGDTGADILTHDDGDSAAVGDDAGGLQDADAGAGTLDDAGDQCAHQNAEDGIGEADEEVGEPCLTLQGLDGIGHGSHAGHQDGKANEDSSDALFLLILAHIEQNADEGEYGAEGGGLEHLDPDAVALQAGKTQQPAGDSGTHIAAHNDADGLMQLHDAAVDEADHHDGGSTGTLDDGGHAQTEEEALEGVIRQFAQDLLQMAAGLFLKGFAHDVHAEQEQSQTAQQRKDIE